jgi:D-sedoheptulose 7-phosphate isomerase
MISKTFKIFQQHSIENIKKLGKYQKKIEKLSDQIAKKILNGGKILTCGNGGSSCDAQHLVAELIVRLTPKNNRRSIPALFLGMDMATLTACGNDLGYNEIFSRSLEGLGKQNDILICYSTSGKSKNIIKVLNKAKKMKIFSICFLGTGGGYAKKLTDEYIVISSNNVMRIQECHLFLTHYLAELIEKKLISQKIV